MKDFQLRVIEERDQLYTKYDKLKSVVFNERPSFISTTDFDLLIEQYAAMSRYLDILNKRIERF